MEKTLKHDTFRACLLAIAGVLITSSAFAQAEDEAPTPGEGLEAPEALEPEPEVSEPEPEVSEPEPEVSEPEPEVSDPEPDGGAGELGRAAAEPTVDEDLEEAGDEAAAPAGETPAERALREEDQTLSAENRLAAANPTSGLPWSMPIVYANTITSRTLNPGAQPTYNPYWNMTLSARPRWNFTDAFSVGGRLDADLELTDAGNGTAISNPVNGNNEVYFQDLRFDATYSMSLPGGIGMADSFGVRVPTSKFSRGANRALGLSGSVMFMRPTQVLGTLIPGIQLGYLYWATTSNVGDVKRGDEEDLEDEIDAPIYGRAIGSARCTSAGANGPVLDGDCADGAGTTRHQLSATVFATIVPGAGFNVSLSYSAIWLKGAELQTACLDAEAVVTPDGESLCVNDGSDTKWRTFGQFSISLGYDFTPYLTGTLSYSTLAIHPDSNGGLENPLRNENTTLGLSFQFRPSALAVHLRDERALEAEHNAEESAANESRPVAF